MSKRSFTAEIISPATDDQVATIEITDEQKARIEKLADELLRTRASVALKRRKYIVTDDEAVSKDASDYIRNKILHIPG